MLTEAAAGAEGPDGGTQRGPGEPCGEGQAVPEAKGEEAAGQPEAVAAEEAEVEAKGNEPAGQPEAIAAEEAEVEAKGEEAAGQPEAVAAEEAEVENKQPAGPSKAKAPERPSEEEHDSPADARPRLDGAVGWNMAEATLNAIPAADGRFLMSLQDGGLDYFLASVRANVGVKAGRYMFEVKVIENLKPQQALNCWRAPMVVRVGLSLSSSSILLGDGLTSISFDSDGSFIHGVKREKVAYPCARNWSRGQTMGVLVNLDRNSPNANTVSLFCNGMRASAPQKLPEDLLGKVLHPTVTYRNVTVQVNFGPEALAPLPFACRLLQDAAADDVEVTRAQAAEPSTLLFPVGLPDQGVFDWLDAFLAENPSYTEISDRKMLEWGRKSGLWPQKMWQPSNDKPASGFGVPSMDAPSVTRLLKSYLPIVKRNYVVMELKANLVAAERKEALAAFRGRGFHKVAAVLLGEPDAETRKRVQHLLLADKQSRLEAERMKRGQSGDAEASAAVLTDEEMKLWHRKLSTPDLAEAVTAKSFATFSIPTEADGFDELRFLWQSREPAAAHLRAWTQRMRLALCVEDLQPGTWFQETWKCWSKAVQGWRDKQNEWKLKKENEENEADTFWKYKAKPTDSEDFDIFSVEDVNNISEGEPLYAQFGVEDWMLLSLRFELHLLVHAFLKDIKDCERPGFQEPHTFFYYSRYYKKTLNTKLFGVSTFPELVAFVKDTVCISESEFLLESKLAADTPHATFLKLTEHDRRQRERRLNVGDETAALNFIKLPAAGQLNNAPKPMLAPKQPFIAPSAIKALPLTKQWNGLAKPLGVSQPVGGSTPSISTQPALMQPGPVNSEGKRPLSPGLVSEQPPAKLPKASQQAPQMAPKLPQAQMAPKLSHQVVKNAQPAPKHTGPLASQQQTHWVQEKQAVRQNHWGQQSQWGQQKQWRQPGQGQQSQGHQNQKPQGQGQQGQREPMLSEAKAGSQATKQSKPAPRHGSHPGRAKQSAHASKRSLASRPGQAKYKWALKQQEAREQEPAEQPARDAQARRQTTVQKRVQKVVTRHCSYSEEEGEGWGTGVTGRASASKKWVKNSRRQAGSEPIGGGGQGSGRRLNSKWVSAAASKQRASTYSSAARGQPEWQQQHQGSAVRTDRSSTHDRRAGSSWDEGPSASYGGSKGRDTSYREDRYGSDRYNDDRYEEGRYGESSGSTASGKARGVRASGGDAGEPRGKPQFWRRASAYEEDQNKGQSGAYGARHRLRTRASASYYDESR